MLRDIQRRKISPAPVVVAAPATNSTVVAAANAQAVTVAVPSAMRVISPANSGDEQVLSSNSSPAATAVAAAAIRATTCTTTPELVEENEKLRKENAQLNQELSRLRSLCGNIYNMMSNYAANQSETTGRGSTDEALDLIRGKLSTAGTESVAPLNGGGGVKAEEEEEPDLSPRLFGVSLGAKRVRLSDDEDGERQSGDGVCRRSSGVKSEPLDVRTGSRDDVSWLDIRMSGKSDGNYGGKL